MRSQKTPRPTDAELAILQVLWKLGPSTVRDVHRELSGYKAVGQTTILKLMQIMNEKGLVARDETERTHIYRPAAGGPDNDYSNEGGAPSLP